ARSMAGAAASARRSAPTGWRAADPPAAPSPPSSRRRPEPRRLPSPRPGPPGATVEGSAPPAGRGGKERRRSSHALLAARLATPLRRGKDVGRRDRCLRFRRGGPPRQRHEPLLAAQRRRTGTVGARRDALVLSVGAEDARLDVVSQGGGEHLVEDALLHRRILDREGGLHAADEVAL